MKELNQVELEQISGAGFWGDIFKSFVDGVEKVVDDVAKVLHDKGIISDSTLDGIEKITDAGAKFIDSEIDKLNI
ncbi:hypothetical protein [Xenorhabdus taiwanensis]|uniref:Uncharacterized protein n=1 Tax=Xenorhabdus taiwanensis TaxID=3085177 RepID=A0ABM8JYQ0_9GAMM|nr:hypothetical protein TCT1_20670 [Xenorhabdus sp. TCT-1]